MTLSATAFVVLNVALYFAGYLNGKSSSKYDILDLKMKLQYAEYKKEERN